MSSAGKISTSTGKIILKRPCNTTTEPTDLISAVLHALGRVDKTRETISSFLWFISWLESEKLVDLRGKQFASCNSEGELTWVTLWTGGSIDPPLKEWISTSEGLGFHPSLLSVLALQLATTIVLDTSDELHIFSSDRNVLSKEHRIVLQSVGVFSPPCLSSNEAITVFQVASSPSQFVYSTSPPSANTNDSDPFSRSLSPTSRSPLNPIVNFSHNLPLLPAHPSSTSTSTPSSLPSFSISSDTKRRRAQSKRRAESNDDDGPIQVKRRVDRPPEAETPAELEDTKSEQTIREPNEPEKQSGKWFFDELECLEAWREDLDEREASIKAREDKVERREKKFRKQRQELAVLEGELERRELKLLRAEEDLKDKTVALRKQYDPYIHPGRYKGRSEVKERAELDVSEGNKIKQLDTPKPLESESPSDHLTSPDHLAPLPSRSSPASASCSSPDINTATTSSISEGSSSVDPSADNSRFPDPPSPIDRPSSPSPTSSDSSSTLASTRKEQTDNLGYRWIAQGNRGGFGIPDEVGNAGTKLLVTGDDKLAQTLWYPMVPELVRDKNGQPQKGVLGCSILAVDSPFCANPLSMRQIPGQTNGLRFIKLLDYAFEHCTCIRMDIYAPAKTFPKAMKTDNAKEWASKIGACMLIVIDPTCYGIQVEQIKELNDLYRNYNRQEYPDGPASLFEDRLLPVIVMTDGFGKQHSKKVTGIADDQSCLVMWNGSANPSSAGYGFDQADEDYVPSNASYESGNLLIPPINSAAAVAEIAELNAFDQFLAWSDRFLTPEAAAAIGKVEKDPVLAELRRKATKVVEDYKKELREKNKITSDGSLPEELLPRPQDSDVGVGLNSYGRIEKPSSDKIVPLPFVDKINLVVNASAERTASSKPLSQNQVLGFLGCFSCRRIVKTVIKATFLDGSSGHRHDTVIGGGKPHEYCPRDGRNGIAFFFVSQGEVDDVDGDWEPILRKKIKSIEKYSLKVETGNLFGLVYGWYATLKNDIHSFETLEASWDDYLSGLDHPQVEYFRGLRRSATGRPRLCRIVADQLGKEVYKGAAASSGSCRVVAARADLVLAHVDACAAGERLSKSKPKKESAEKKKSVKGGESQQNSGTSKGKGKADTLLELVMEESSDDEDDLESFEFNQ